MFCYPTSRACSNCVLKYSAANSTKVNLGWFPGWGNQSLGLCKSGVSCHTAWTSPPVPCSCSNGTGVMPEFSSGDPFFALVTTTYFHAKRCCHWPAGQSVFSHWQVSLQWKINSAASSSNELIFPSISRFISGLWHDQLEPSDGAFCPSACLLW